MISAWESGKHAAPIHYGTGSPFQFIEMAAGEAYGNRSGEQSPCKKGFSFNRKDHTFLKDIDLAVSIPG